MTGRGAIPRDGLRDIAPYAAPQIEVPVRLNTNECPYPLPEGFIADLQKAASETAFNRYPDRDARALREDLTASTGHPYEGTWAANGSNEILLQLFQAYGGPGRTALTFTPTYEMYPRFAWVTHTRTAEVQTPDPFEIGPEQVAAASALRPEIALICSPNNPTGNTQPPEVLGALAEALPDSLVIVDEAYIEFGGTTALGLWPEHPNVAVVRTMSKAFALAGARLGYLLADPQVVDDLQRVRLPYHLSALTQATGRAALAHHEEAMAILDLLRQQRDRIVTGLAEMGVPVYPSDANFVMFRPEAGPGPTFDALLERGVLVRDVSNNVPGCLRVTAGTPEETGAFLAAIEEIR